jgi:hypothetical protein
MCIALPRFRADRKAHRKRVESISIYWDQSTRYTQFLSRVTDFYLLGYIWASAGDDGRSLMAVSPVINQARCRSPGFLLGVIRR